MAIMAQSHVEANEIPIITIKRTATTIFLIMNAMDMRPHHGTVAYQSLKAPQLSATRWWEVSFFFIYKKMDTLGILKNSAIDAVNVPMMGGGWPAMGRCVYILDR